MRLWHYQLLPYLPNLQLKGQLRELVAIMHTWRDQGKTNHLLINYVMNYPKSELRMYYIIYKNSYKERFGKDISKKFDDEFINFVKNENIWDYYTESELYDLPSTLYKDWQNKEYLRICMANLYEKYLGIGKTKLTSDEWKRLLMGYKKITGEEYYV